LFPNPAQALLTLELPYFFLFEKAIFTFCDASESSILDLPEIV
jgi:hypothetical protein